MQSLRTIECLLVPSEWVPPSKKNPDPSAFASGKAKHYIWQLSVASTQLCKALNNRITQDPEFETWRQDGRIPAKTLKALWNAARSDSPYKEMPERFSRSAWIRVQNIYAGWFKTKKKLRDKLEKTVRWLTVAKSDLELIQMTGSELEQIQARANEIVSEAKSGLERKTRSQKKASSDNSDLEDTTSSSEEQKSGVISKSRLTDELYEIYFALDKADVAFLVFWLKWFQRIQRGETVTIEELCLCIVSLIHYLINERLTNVLDRCAIVHLIKNGCQVATQPEDPKRFASTCRKKRKLVERSEKQLAARLPRVKDIGSQASKQISDATHTVALKNDEFSTQLANSQRKVDLLPYPVMFYSGDDLEWYLMKRKHPVTGRVEERIFVKFKGLKTSVREKLKREGLKKEALRKEYIFEICCDRRHLHLFRQFVEDWKIYTSNKRRNSVSLFLLQSANLVWRKTKKAASRDIPKKTNNSQEKLESDLAEDKKQTRVNEFLDEYQLYLHGTIDSRCLTAEGTELVRAEEIEKANSRIRRYEERQEQGESLSDTQQKDLDKLRSQLAHLNNPLLRPSQPLYAGSPNLVVGVSFGQAGSLVVAVVDVLAQKAITYRNTRQLLGKDYKLLSAYHLEQQHNAHQRHKQQKRGKVSRLSESNKGKYIDRLLAKAIIEVARKYKTSSIALPNLTGLRETIQSGIEAEAEQRFPNDRAKQDKYMKRYKIKVHRWSYGRLTQSLKDCAGKIGIPVEQGQQPREGDFKQKAVQIALSAFAARKNDAAS